jgi:putative membrane protein
MNLEKYINRSKSNDKEIWLHNLPNDETLFDVIDNLRKQYNILRYTFVINQEIRITGITIDRGIDFSNCIFKKDVDFSGCIFNGIISFNGATFQHDVNFSNCNFKLQTSFANVSFKGHTNFGRSIFYDVIFKRATFSNKKNENFVNFSFSFFYKANFNSSKFKTVVSFEHSKFIYSSLNYISFHSTVFENIVYFSFTKLVPNEEKHQIIEKTLSTPLEFVETEFNNDTFFDKVEYTGDVIFSKCIFGQNNIVGKTIPSIHFSNAKFNQKVKFSSSTFNSKVILENTKFKDLLYFHKVDFYQPTQFHFTDFRKKAFFSNTHFFEEVQFLYCEVESSSFIRFESSIFEKCLEISRSNFDYCKLRFWDIQIKGEDKINEYTNYEKDFGETLIEPSVYSKIRESFRFIKSTFYAENNKIEGLRFYEKEMSVYLEEKRAEDKKSKQSKDKEELMTLNSNLTTTTSNKKGLNNIRKEYVNTYNFLSLIELFFLMICIIPLFLIVNSFLFILPIFYIPIVICTKKCRNMNLKRYMLDKTSVLIKKVSLYIAIVVRICFYRLISFKSKKHSLFIVAFFVIILFLAVVYITLHKYIWYWITLFLFLLWIYIEFYQNRKNIKNSIKSNNYIFLILFTIPMIIVFVMLYGMNNYKNDWVYKLLNYLSIQFSNMLKDIGSFSFILTIVFVFTAIGFNTISKIHDKFILWFNKNSNEFDTNWIAGVNFSLLVGILTYFIVLLFMNSEVRFLPNTEGVSNFITSLVDVFNLTKWVNLEIIGIRLKGFPYLLLFIGRIFIGYGYYQTIQAFRKFGKS